MQIEIFDDPDKLARRAAEFIAEAARTAAGQRERFVMAVSGGHTPWKMLAALGNEDVPWSQVHVAQVDERVRPRATRPAT